VSATDLEPLEALEAAWIDSADLGAVRGALAESDERIPYEKLRADLGLG